MSIEKLEKLHDLLRSYGSCVVAYSGGVDSVFLARVAWDVLGERALAAIADSPSLPRRELEEMAPHQITPAERSPYSLAVIGGTEASAVQNILEFLVS